MKLTGKHIHDFIEALPGGNPPQYARLLNISAIRITKFLAENSLGRKLVKNGKVKASIMGVMPSWANKNTERGLLTANEIPNNHRILERVCAGMPSTYRVDANHMFKMLVQMTTGNMSIESAFTEIATPFIEMSKVNQEMQERIAGYNKQIAQLERLVQLQETAITNGMIIQQALPAPVN